MKKPNRKNRRKKTRVLNTFLDKYVTNLVAPHIPSGGKYLPIHNGIILLKKINTLMTEDDKIFINLFIKERVSELKQGNISEVNFSRLINTLYMAHRITCYFLDKKLCKEETALKVLHDLSNKAFLATEAILTDMNKRHEKTGRYIASGDDIIGIKEISQVLDAVIEITTVGEWYTVWHMLVLDLMRLDRENNKFKRVT